MTLRRNGIHLTSFHFFLSIMVLLFVLSGCTPKEQAPRVVDGVIDLSSWDFDNSGPVRLFGDWEFNWGDGFASEDAKASDRFHVPGLWHGETAEGRSLSPFGNAVYRLRLRMPSDHPEDMAVLVAGGMSVCEVWINGTRVAASGTLGRDLESEKPVDHYVIAECPAPCNIAEITLRVSNYHNVQGGLNSDVLLGTSRQILGFYSTPRLLGASMAGALFCLSLLYMALFYMRRSGREYLYFGAFCLFWCVAILFSPSSGFLMAELVPSMPWGWYITVSMLPYGLTVPLMLMFYHRLFPKKYGPVMERVCWTVGLLYMAYILMTPPNAYDVVLFAYFLVSVVVLLYMFFCFAMDLYRREKGTGILVIGYLALGFTELDDMLFDLNIIDSASLRPVGVFLFMLSYALYLAFRFSRSFTKVQTLSEELEVTNVRLLQMDRLKDEFLANTTHELKTPLAGMVGIAESLLAGSGGGVSDMTAGHLKVIAHSGKRLSKLINDVLDLSRLRHRDIVLQSEAVRPYGATQRVVALGETLKRGNDILLVNAIPADFPPVKADPDRLEQILFNLVGNSLKFTDSGHVTVSATQRGGMAEIVVTDTGPGIAPADQKRIFNAYEQGDAHSTGGAGLGLSISRHLVELHGGILSVDSEAGNGSSFRFSLPLAETSSLSDPAGLPATSTEGEEGTSDLVQDMDPSVFVTSESLQSHSITSDGKYQVLVVDDEPVNLQVVASILNISGISFCTAENGSEALRMLEQGHEPDMLLLDVMMPDMNGYAVCRELRKKYPASVLPIVLLTVKNRVEDIVEGFSAGANDYLTKPFSREELSARVATQLKLREAYAALEENLELKRELELRRKTESGLRFMQARLAKILDTLDDAIVGVNPSNEIAFCNQPFELLVGGTAQALLGQPLASLLVGVDNKSSAALLDYAPVQAGTSGQPSLFENIAMTAGDGGETRVSFWATDMEIEEEAMCLMVVRPATVSDTPHSASIPAQLFQSLNANRQRVLNLEETMLSLESGDPESRQQVLDDLKSLDELLEGISSRMQVNKGHDKRPLAVRVMNLAVDCWTESTGTQKADMAEQSGLWNVYMERDGYFRTQTLDKYLEEGTLPGKPRWKKVLATADFRPRQLSE
ncbi:response regulator [uncultured Pseudodesulfovibrio sp.]|uniref:response regulator n=1 Tax=uncultured Pseudodesulfovibrio sp. TaxID=2035858 RepID=UPI0029C77752|nr:response regulator [uncultured Pseudodesulfovibrio sp.]